MTRSGGRPVWMSKATLAIRYRRAALFWNGRDRDRHPDARASADFALDLVKRTLPRATHAPCPPIDRDPRRRRGRVLAADGGGEEGTHERLQGHLRELI